MVQTRSMTTTKTSYTKTIAVAKPHIEVAQRTQYDLRPRQARITVTIPITPYALRPRITTQ